MSAIFVFTNGNPITVPKILAGDHMTSRQFHRWKLVTTVLLSSAILWNATTWTCMCHEMYQKMVVIVVVTSKICVTEYLPFTKMDPSVRKYLVSLWLVSHFVSSLLFWFNLSFIIRMYLKANFQPWCNAVVCFCFAPLLYKFEFRSYLGLSCFDEFPNCDSLV